MNDRQKTAERVLATAVETVAGRHRDHLEKLKSERVGLERPDFIWHYLLQSFSTWGSSRGFEGLMKNQSNYEQVTYDALLSLLPGQREKQAEMVLRAANVRAPVNKARLLAENVEIIRELGGPAEARRKLLERPGADAKIEFLKTLSGVGPKYARNILMDVYHPDFHDRIAIDQRIQVVTKAIGLQFDDYSSHENFLLGVATLAGLNGWELDRILYNYRDEVIAETADESRPDFNFKVVVSSNGRQKASRKRATASDSTRGEKYKRYFQTLIDEMREEHKFTGARVGQPQNSYSFRSGFPEFHYNAVFAANGKTRVDVYLESGNQEANKKLFDALKLRESDIVAVYGSTLDWSRLDHRRASRIAIYRDGTIEATDSELDEIRSWHVEHLLRMKKVFAPEIETALKQS